MVRAIGAEGVDELDPEDARAALRAPAAKARAKAASPAGKAAPSAKVAPKASAPSSSSGIGGPPDPLPDVETVTVVAEAPGRGRGRGRGRGGRGPRVPRDFIRAIGGGRAVYKDHVPGDPSRNAYSNWMFECPHHDKCYRTMGLGPRNTMRGDLEPLAFFHVWRDTPPDPILGHRKTPVDDAAVERFLNENRDALLLMKDHFVDLSP